MKKIILFLALAVSLSAQNFKHESGGINGVSDYSEGTVGTDTLRTRYIRLLDGLNSDSIASYIYFDGDTSRWSGDPIKIGNNSIIVKDDTVKISNAMLTVSGQVQADTLVPYHNSTIYIRHFTVDTIEVVKYFHQQEIALIDSLTWWGLEGDTVKIDPSVGNRIEVEDNSATVFSVDETGDLTAQKVVAQDSLRIGQETTTDNVVPALVMKGDADSDWTAVTPMTYTQTIVQNASPGTAYVSNVLNQGVGYSFDKGIGIGSGNNPSSLYAIKLSGTIYGYINTTAPSSGIIISNTVAATSSPVKQSPRILLTAQVWDSTATAASKTQNFSTEVIPVSGGTILPAPSALTARTAYSFDHNGGGYGEIASLYGDGTWAGKNGVANGTATFSSGASADTVTYAGCATTDIYTFEWTSDPGTPGAVWFERKAGSFIIHTAAAVTGTPTWMWTRNKGFD